MSVKVISGIAGGATTIGGGAIAIYILNNTDKTQSQKEWNTLLNQNPRYINAKKTGKIVDFVTYKNNETVDNNANYFLMEIMQKEPNNSNFPSTFSELEMYIGDDVVHDEIAQNDKNFPLFCFQDNNVDKIEELNLNNLKKFSSSCSGKYILASLKNNSGQSNSFLRGKNLDDWNDKNTTVKLIFRNGIDNKYCGKMLRIFHKHYQPTINNSNP